jgi:hypothetical protein
MRGNWLVGGLTLVRLGDTLKSTNTAARCTNDHRQSAQALIWFYGPSTFEEQRKNNTDDYDEKSLDGGTHLLPRSTPTDFSRRQLAPVCGFDRVVKPALTKNVRIFPPAVLRTDWLIPVGRRYDHQFFRDEV